VNNGVVVVLMALLALLLLAVALWVLP